MATNATEERTWIEHQLAGAWVAGGHTFLADDWSAIDLGRAEAPQGYRHANVSGVC